MPILVNLVLVLLKLGIGQGCHPIWKEPFPITGEQLWWFFGSSNSVSSKTFCHEMIHDEIFVVPPVGSVVLELRELGELKEGGRRHVIRVSGPITCRGAGRVSRRS